MGAVADEPIVNNDAVLLTPMAGDDIGSVGRGIYNYSNLICV